MRRFPGLIAPGLVALALAGCGHGEPAAPRVPQDPPCAKVAHHLLDLMTPAEPAPVETTKLINDMILERCQQDGWSTEAQQCMLGTQTLADNGRCQELLTDTQRQALADEIDAKLPRGRKPPAGGTAPADATPPDAAPAGDGGQ